MSLPTQVSIVEVGARDGLQNEKQCLGVSEKVELIGNLKGAGLKKIEAGSFVSPKWVPQMANSDEVYSALDAQVDVDYPMLVPNEKGFFRALELGVKEISCFTAVSDTFNQKNINCSTEESLQRIENIVKMAKENELKVRGYVSTVIACPYQGKIEPHAVLPVVKRLLDLGCYEISLGDTIGVGTPEQVHQLLDVLLKTIDVNQLALHLHDTYGQALANIYAGLQRGISVFDSSVAGLGGCPYAKGASGNVATEDLVYMLNGLGIDCGVDLEQLIGAGNTISGVLGRQNQSKVSQALSH